MSLFDKIIPRLKKNFSPIPAKKAVNVTENKKTKPASAISLAEISVQNLASLSSDNQTVAIKTLKTIHQMLVDQPIDLPANKLVGYLTKLLTDNKDVVILPAIKAAVAEQQTINTKQFMQALVATIAAGEGKEVTKALNDAHKTATSIATDQQLQAAIAHLSHTKLQQEITLLSDFLHTHTQTENLTLDDLHRELWQTRSSLFAQGVTVADNVADMLARLQFAQTELLRTQNRYFISQASQATEKSAKAKQPANLAVRPVVKKTAKDTTGGKDGDFVSLPETKQSIQIQPENATAPALALTPKDLPFVANPLEVATSLKNSQKDTIFFNSPEVTAEVEQFSQKLIAITSIDGSASQKLANIIGFTGQNKQHQHFSGLPHLNKLVRSLATKRLNRADKALKSVPEVAFSVWTQSANDVVKAARAYAKLHPVGQSSTTDASSTTAVLGGVSTGMAASSPAKAKLLPAINKSANQANNSTGLAPLGRPQKTKPAGTWERFAAVLHNPSNKDPKYRQQVESASNALTSFLNHHAQDALINSGLTNGSAAQQQFIDTALAATTLDLSTWRAGQTSYFDTDSRTIIMPRSITPETIKAFARTFKVLFSTFNDQQISQLELAVNDPNLTPADALQLFDVVTLNTGINSVLAKYKTQFSKYENLATTGGPASSQLIRDFVSDLRQQLHLIRDAKQVAFTPSDLKLLLDEATDAPASTATLQALVRNTLNTYFNINNQQLVTILKTKNTANADAYAISNTIKQDFTAFYVKKLTKHTKPGTSGHKAGMTLLAHYDSVFRYSLPLVLGLLAKQTKQDLSLSAAIDVITKAFARHSRTIDTATKSTSDTQSKTVNS